MLKAENLSMKNYQSFREVMDVDIDENISKLMLEERPPYKCCNNGY